eukprot:6205333-Pleurochrysis_carterae.AAC.1
MQVHLRANISARQGGFSTHYALHAYKESLSRALFPSQPNAMHLYEITFCCRTQTGYGSEFMWTRVSNTPAAYLDTSEKGVLRLSSFFTSISYRSVSWKPTSQHMDTT